MQLQYTPGQRVRLKGNWGGYPTTVVRITDFILTLRFDDLAEPTLILLEHVRDLEASGEIEIISNPRNN